MADFTGRSHRAEIYFSIQQKGPADAGPDKNACHMTVPSSDAEGILSKKTGFNVIPNDRRDPVITLNERRQSQVFYKRDVRGCRHNPAFLIHQSRTTDTYSDYIRTAHIRLMQKMFEATLEDFTKILFALLGFGLGFDFSQ